MDRIYCGMVVLAEARFRGMGNRFRGDHAKLDPNDVFIGIGILALVIFAVVVLQRLVARQDVSRRCNSPWKLFRELCKAHQLDRKERTFLKRVAAYQHLKQPALLFVEPDRLKPAHLSRQQKTQISLAKSIYKRLFADLRATKSETSDATSVKQSPEADGAERAHAENPPIDSTSPEGDIEPHLQESSTE